MAATASHPGLDRVGEFFSRRGWRAFAFQREAWEHSLAGRSGLITVPTGAGKTYAAYLGPLAELIAEPASPAPARSLRILYITPLRAVSRDIEHALRLPIEELSLPLAVESRTGDTSSAVRARQRRTLPDVLITTPESLSLLLSYPDAPARFRSLRAVIIDEWHELLASKRGTQVELALARLRRFSPAVRTWALSATLGNIGHAAQAAVGAGGAPVIVSGEIERPVEIETLLPRERRELPWAGHMGLRMLPRVLASLDPDRSTLLFTNTRAQAELWHGAILASRPEWEAITALHHGSIDRDERERVEAGLKAGTIRICVATSSLDLGVDFSPVERVYQIGSPKGIARLLQRAGRSGHRPGETCRVTCVPTHALELVEIAAVREAVAHRRIEPRVVQPHPLDVLAQHMVTCALGGGFRADELFEEVRTTMGFADLARADFDWTIELVTRGGATLSAYPEFRKVAFDDTGLAHVPSKRTAALHRLNVGTITGEATVPIRYVGGRSLGSIEEYFVAQLTRGQKFMFAGKILEFVMLHDMVALVRPARGKTNFTPHWSGTKLPISESLGEGVRRTLERALDAERDRSGEGPELGAVAALVRAQASLSHVPAPDEVLVEIMDSREGSHLFVFPFDGRLVHGGIAAITALRLGRLGKATFTLTANDYGFEILAERGYPFGELYSPALFAPEDLAADAEASVNLSELGKRQFREVARVAGLVFQSYPGTPKSARQVSASSSLIYEVFEQFDPGNLLLHQSRREVLERQFERSRLARTMARLRDARHTVTHPDRPTPLAFPLMTDRFGSMLTHESLADRIDKMQRIWEEEAALA
ncbi:MAG TPA: ligase-associated DNA damage response DEXH box helicase [Phycisphaerales bacterium]|nr:ligase-associated DNA damage response DEXH box helicase [Phycisphaerales bacterium]